MIRSADSRTWLTNTPLNVSSFMGAVLLIGLDMKNGILIVEYVQQLRKEGLELQPALLLAGERRFRPIRGGIDLL